MITYSYISRYITFSRSHRCKQVTPGDPLTKLNRKGKAKSQQSGKTRWELDTTTGSFQEVDDDETNQDVIDEQMEQEVEDDGHLGSGPF